MGTSNGPSGKNWLRCLSVSDAWTRGQSKDMPAGARRGDEGRADAEVKRMRE